ncbi:MAG: arginine--tRNA ligase [Chromatiales bacterium]|nr:arginine--tRNA ligase [Chromatiales bacterium]MDP6150332.1 arginine--tRNA ligase [Gammaproteobacteria bacterium]MDP7093411.1 arginine--tRNA ligase [Gammaproteobacteria bacterium]HJP05122.1 arginine--tRNA ligase [Gammaproteobacteria bacterium]
MKTEIENLLSKAIGEVFTAGDASPPLEIERTRDTQHGHFSSNIAMRLAKMLGKSPRDIAADIVEALPESDQVAAVDIAGPGFINFRLAPDAFHAELHKIICAEEKYGNSDLGGKRKVNLEYVSANPTGPLHVGHGRHAAYGACVANLLIATGHDVHQEYYVNDAGRQMDIIALSVWLRALQAQGQKFNFPAGAYQGEYVQTIAAELGSAEMPDGLFEALPEDGDAQLDLLIQRVCEALGEEGFDAILEVALDNILADIRDDLGEFGVHPDEWFSEKSLTSSGAVDRALKLLAENDVTYEKDGATWFRAIDYGDEKDRVVVRDNGRTTYFASDIAYHLHKRERGFEDLIDIWGADHHGYVARVTAGLEAMGQPTECLHVELVQFVALYRAGKKVQMSTRSGDFVTLRQLREEVGNDAARLFFVMRSNEQHLDFDLDLAKSKSNENPVYYLQYAHARVCSVMAQLAERGLSWDDETALRALPQLVEEHEQSLMLTLTRFPEIVEAATLQRAPQHVVHYLKELAQEFHAYYNAHKFIVDDDGLRNARIMLVLATRQVMRNGLGLLGVTAPDKM